LVRGAALHETPESRQGRRVIGVTEPAPPEANRDRLGETPPTSGADRRPLVLIVDDEEAIRRLCVASLGGDYRTVEAPDGRQALRLLYEHRPDLVLLDLRMPVMDGWETLRRIRDLTAVPVIILSAHGEDNAVVRGLNAGAQDYVVKPFSPVQLLARVRATLRDHALPPATTDERLSFDDGRLVIDVGRRLAIVRGREVPLSATEYKLLELLARHPGQVLTHDQILEQVWGPVYCGASGYVKTYAGLIRKKIEADPSRPRYLLSRRGFGYLLNVRPTSLRLGRVAEATDGRSGG
jgi:two-component system KDP operon response regulator KdpE